MKDVRHIRQQAESGGKVDAAIISAQELERMKEAFSTPDLRRRDFPRFGIALRHEA